MTADGWRCPECHLILAPDVREHRCDPPSAGVTAIRPGPGKDPDLTAMGVREIRRGIWSIDEARARLGMEPWVYVREQMLLDQARRNSRRWRQPGSAA